MGDAQSPPDVVVITARHEETVAADRAELLVTTLVAVLVPVLVDTKGASRPDEACDDSTPSRGCCYFDAVFSGTTSHLVWASTKTTHPAGSVHLVVCCFLPVYERYEPGPSVMS